MKKIKNETNPGQFSQEQFSQDQFSQDHFSQGWLVKRYKRFLADIITKGGETITAHCANTGSMRGLLEEGAEVAFSKNQNPKAKLGYRWELVKNKGVWVGIHTGRANPIVEELLTNRIVPSVSSYTGLKREVKYGDNSRIDFLLTAENKPPCYIEVKSVTLERKGVALFPDSVSARGTKHLNELANQAHRGNRALMVYLVQRSDCESFDIAADIDEAYADAFKKARTAGVDVEVHMIEWLLFGWRYKAPLPLRLQVG